MNQRENCLILSPVGLLSKINSPQEKKHNYFVPVLEQWEPEWRNDTKTALKHPKERSTMEPKITFVEIKLTRGESDTVAIPVQSISGPCQSDFEDERTGSIVALATDLRFESLKNTVKTPRKKSCNNTSFDDEGRRNVGASYVDEAIAVSDEHASSTKESCSSLCAGQFAHKTKESYHRTVVPTPYDVARYKAATETITDEKGLIGEFPVSSELHGVMHCGVSNNAEGTASSFVQSADFFLSDNDHDENSSSDDYENYHRLDQYDSDGELIYTPGDAPCVPYSSPNFDCPLQKKDYYCADTCPRCTDIGERELDFQAEFSNESDENRLRSVEDIKHSNTDLSASTPEDRGVDNFYANSTSITFCSEEVNEQQVAASNNNATFWYNANGSSLLEKGIQQVRAKRVYVEENIKTSIEKSGYQTSNHATTEMDIKAMTGQEDEFDDTEDVNSWKSERHATDYHWKKCKTPARKQEESSVLQDELTSKAGKGSGNGCDHNVNHDNNYTPICPERNRAASNINTPEPTESDVDLSLQPQNIPIQFSGKGKASVVLRGGFDTSELSDIDNQDLHFCQQKLPVCTREGNVTDPYYGDERGDELNTDKNQQRVESKYSGQNEACLPIYSNFSEQCFGENELDIRDTSFLQGQVAVEHEKRNELYFKSKKNFLTGMKKNKASTTGRPKRRKQTNVKYQKKQKSNGRTCKAFVVKDGNKKAECRKKKERPLSSAFKEKAVLFKSTPLPYMDSCLRSSSLSKFVNAPMQNETHFATISLKRTISQTSPSFDTLHTVPTKRRKLSIKKTVLQSYKLHCSARRYWRVSVITISKELLDGYYRGNADYHEIVESDKLPKQAVRECSAECVGQDAVEGESTKDHNSEMFSISTTEDNQLIEILKAVLQSKELFAKKLTFYSEEISSIIGPGEKITGNCCNQGTLGRGGISTVDLVNFQTLSRADICTQFAVKTIPFEKVRVSDIWIPLTLPTLFPGIMPVHAVESDSENAYLYMPVAKGDTLERMLQNGKLAEASDKMKVLFSLIRTVKRMHQYNIIHGDLKPGNILFLRTDDLTSLHISDFGSAVLGRSDLGPYFHVRTPQFVPPEIHEISKRKYHENMKKVDIWQCGTILFRMVFGKTIWHEEWRNSNNDEANFVRFLKRNGKEAVSKMLREMPHPYRDGQVADLLRGLLEFNPDERLTAQQALGILSREDLFGDQTSRDDIS